MVLSSQSLMPSQGSLEDRFSHLLQPIRDLARNWDVDIAHFLEEYLEDLEKIEITFNDGATTMNFSEAALLIQGSAGVYAKKVEYLYSLVYQVLDLITQKKKAKSTENGEGADENGEQNDYEDDQFLPLDDALHEDGEGACSYLVEKDATSNKSVRIMPEMPTRLIPLEESEKGENTLYNKKGEVMGNHCDFNINTGFLSTDGSILLELGDQVFLGLSALLPPRQDRALQQCGIEEAEDIDNVAVDTGVGEEDVDDVAGVDMMANDPGDGGDAHNQAGLTGAVHKSVGCHRRSHRRVTFARPAITKPAKNAWELLDPHEPSKAVEKPLVKKKTFKIPVGLEDTTTKKRKLKKEIKTELQPLCEFVEKAFSNRSKFPKSPFKVPEFPELEDAFWEEFKIREAIKKEELKMLKKEEREELIKEEECDAEDKDGDYFADDDFEDIDNDAIPQLQLDPDLFTGSQPTSLRRITGDTDTGFQTGFQTGSSDDLTKLSYEDLVQKYVERFWASAAEFEQITDLSRRVAEWEEKIKPVLEQEESHEPFDIHKYGTHVLQQCIRGEPVHFKEIVRGKKQYEVCRYTLATLQLANVYNVELSIKPDKTGNIIDCLYVTLISTKRHHEDLEEYRAPSITTS